MPKDKKDSNTHVISAAQPPIQTTLLKACPAIIWYRDNAAQNVQYNRAKITVIRSINYP